MRSVVTIYHIAPNIRLPLVITRLTIITDNKKKTSPRMEVISLHQHLLLFDDAIFFMSLSA